MKVTFWLLDISYETKNEAPEIWLWGITPTGQRVLIIDRTFVPYFYAVVKEGVATDRVFKELVECRYPFVAKPELVDRRFFGKPVRAFKLQCVNAEASAKCARQVRQLEGIEDCLEDDIRAAMRYLIDNEVIPSAWHEVEAIEEPNLQ